MTGPTAEVIEENDLFAGISLPVLADFLEAGEEVEYPDNTTIIQEGSRTEGLYYIIEGEADVIKGGETYLDVLGKGECFGEMSMFTAETASASVVSNGPLTVYFFSESLVNKFIDEHKNFAVVLLKNIIKRMSERLRKSTDAIRTIRDKTKSLLNNDFEKIFSTLDMDIV
ncbi:MAG: Crp/Fnr family transcriptional regulator [bacterium]